MLKKIVKVEKTTNKLYLPKSYTEKYGKELVLDINGSTITLNPVKMLKNAIKECK